MKFSAAVCLVFLYGSQPFQAAQYSKLKNAMAIALDPKVMIVHYCNVKALARNCSTLNFGVTFVRPVVKPLNVTVFQMIDQNF